MENEEDDELKIAIVAESKNTTADFPNNSSKSNDNYSKPRRNHERSSETLLKQQKKEDLTERLSDRKGSSYGTYLHY